MATILAGLYGVLATIPFLSFFLIYFIAHFITKDKKESFRWALHTTMILLLSAVSYLMKDVTGSSLGFWLIIVVLILLGGVLLWLQWKIRQTVLVGRVFKTIWYFGFGIFSISYIVLFIWGIVVHYTNA